MTKILSFALGLLVSANVSASALYEFKGTVQKIEDGRAVIQTETGEKRILLKSLPTRDQKTVRSAVGSKKEITLKIKPELLKPEN